MFQNRVFEVERQMRWVRKLMQYFQNNFLTHISPLFMFPDLRLQVTVFRLHVSSIYNIFHIFWISRQNMFSVNYQKRKSPVFHIPLHEILPASNLSYTCLIWTFGHVRFTKRWWKKLSQALSYGKTTMEIGYNPCAVHILHRLELFHLTFYDL